MNVRDLAKARDFHGNPNESNLEDRIAEVEGRFGESVKGWRNENSPTVAPVTPSEFVVHIAVRTKHLRDGAAEAFSMLIDELAENMFTGKKSLAKMQKMTVKALKEELRKKGMLPLFKQRYGGYWERVLQTKAAEALRGPEPLAEFQAILDGFRTNIDVESIAAGGQKKALQQSPVPKVRSGIFQALDWSVRISPTEKFILGDLGAVAYKKNSSGGLFSIAADEVRMLVLPISSSRALVGCSSGQTAFSEDEINRTMAELSRDFFVSSQCTSREEGYQRLIGARSELVSEAEIKGWFT
jgi:hypothetical protein